MVPDETKELNVFQSCASLTSSATYPVSPPMFMLSVGPLSLSGFKRIHMLLLWLSLELPELYRKYDLHTIIQLKEMNFATTK